MIDRGRVGASLAGMFTPAPCLTRMLAALAMVLAQARAAVPDGAAIYAEKCQMCHQPTGQGAPPAFPPLAQADWLLQDRARTIRVLCEGLSGPITVNGKTYRNAMPAQVLDDAQVAAVLTFVTTSWGNTARPFSVEEVRVARATSRFKTYADLVSATAFQPLPKPPAGYAVREVAQLPEFCTRLASTPRRPGVYVLAQNGGLYHLDPQGGALTPVLKPSDYLNPKLGDATASGCTFDAAGRLWLITNQKIDSAPVEPMAEVTIWRSTAEADGHPAKLQPWFTVRYPFGNGGFNHGVSHLAFGPDGMLYVASGSRTDGGEPCRDPRTKTQGEVDETACVWRLDPRAETPKIAVIARGIRNPYGFAWDGQGHLFTFSNGPDYSSPEEMDFIEPGKHYGFPYQFSDLPVRLGFPYPHTPAPPEGVAFTHPVPNLGPAAGGKLGGLFTFDAHSCPGGVIWCGEDFPAPLGGGFLVTRFGNLLGAPAAPEDVGFDVLSMHLTRREDGTWQARTETVLAPLGRPLDAHRIGPGRALILEYTRPISFKDGLGWLPGRIIELSAAPE